MFAVFFMSFSCPNLEVEFHTTLENGVKSHMKWFIRELLTLSCIERVSLSLEAINLDTHITLCLSQNKKKTNWYTVTRSLFSERCFLRMVGHFIVTPFWKSRYFCDELAYIKLGQLLTCTVTMSFCFGIQNNNWTFCDHELDEYMLDEYMIIGLAVRRIWKYDIKHDLNSKFS